ncbi:ribosome recycling factor [Fibrobacterota bacterium]
MDENAINARMQKTLDSLKKALTKIRTGVATPAMLDNIMVDYYGTMTPINHAANVTIPEPRCLLIQPFEKNMLEVIEKAIHSSDLGLPPNNDGKSIRLTLPVLTTERREELAKKVRGTGEDAKIGIRNIRRDENENLKAEAKKESHSEDVTKNLKDKIQSLTDDYIKRIDDIVAEKEKDIMNV